MIPNLQPGFAFACKGSVLANLDALRHQAFSEPLPFGDGLKIYDHLRNT